ncbi:hypothetical protein BC629DRAFT_1446781, partial [Irpex lacteus]
MPVNTRKHHNNPTSSNQDAPPPKNTAKRTSNPASKPNRQNHTASNAPANSKKHQLQDGSRNTSTDDLPLKRVHKSKVTSKAQQNDIPPPAKIDSESDGDSSDTPLREKQQNNSHGRHNHKLSKANPSASGEDSNSSGEDGSEKFDGSDSDDSMDMQPGADDSQRSIMAKKVISEMPVVLSKQRATDNSARASHSTGLKANHTNLASGPTSDVMNVDVPAMGLQLVQPQPVWPLDTEIAPPSGRNGHRNLRNQTPRMERILRAALPEIFFQFATRYALTRNQDPKGWVTTCMVTVATALGDTVVADRIHNDPKYSPTFAGLLLNRVESWRSQMTNVAFDNIEGQYRLGKRHGESYKYTFAFKHNKNRKSDRKSNTKLNMKKPYCHPILSKILRVCFKMDNGAYATVARERFKIGDGVCELPDALIALSATL